MSLPAHVTATLSAGPEDVVRPSIWVGGTMTARLQLLDDRREPVAAEGVSFLFRRPDGVEIIMPGASSDGTNRPPFWLAALEIDQGGAWAVRGRSTLPLRQLDWVTFDAVVGPVAPGAPAAALWLQQDGAAQVTAEGGLLTAARIDLLPEAADPAGMALPGILPDGQSAKLPVALLRADARQVAGAEAERKAEELIPDAVQEPARAAARDEVQPLVQEAADSAATADRRAGDAEAARRIVEEKAVAAEDARRLAAEKAVEAATSEEVATGAADMAREEANRAKDQADRAAPEAQAAAQAVLTAKVDRTAPVLAGPLVLQPLPLAAVPLPALHPGAQLTATDAPAGRGAMQSDGLTWRWQADGSPAVLIAAGMTFTRGSRATMIDGLGLQDLPPSAPRLQSNRRLRLDGARTNLSANPHGVGGGPGVLPDGWSWLGTLAIPVAVLGAGTEDGMSYIDIQLDGNATGTGAFALLFDPIGSIPAAANERYAAGIHVTRLSGTAAGHSVAVTVRPRSASAGLSPLITASTTPSAGPLREARKTAAGTITAAGTTNVVAGLQFQATAANAAVSTIYRISTPTLERAATPSAPVLPLPGTIAQASRAAELLSMPIGGAGTLAISLTLDRAAAGAPQTLAQIDDGTEANRLRLLNPDGGLTVLASRTAGGADTNTAASPAITASNVTRFILAWDASGMTFQREGFTAQSLSGDMPPALNTLRLGAGMAGADPMFGEIAAVLVLPNRAAAGDFGGLYTQLRAAEGAVPVVAIPFSPPGGLRQTKAPVAPDDVASVESVGRSVAGGAAILAVQNRRLSGRTRPLVQWMQDYVNASDFGDIVGDGVADDSATIQAAINALQGQVANGRQLARLRLPGRPLIRAEGLTITRPITLDADGRAPTRLFQRGASSVPALTLKLAHNGTEWSSSIARVETRNLTVLGEDAFSMAGRDVAHGVVILPPDDITKMQPISFNFHKLSISGVAGKGFWWPPGQTGSLTGDEFSCMGSFGHCADINSHNDINLDRSAFANSRNGYSVILSGSGQVTLVQTNIWSSKMGNVYLFDGSDDANRQISLTHVSIDRSEKFGMYFDIRSTKSIVNLQDVWFRINGYPEPGVYSDIVVAPFAAPGVLHLNDGVQFEECHSDNPAARYAKHNIEFEPGFAEAAAPVVWMSPNVKFNGQPYRASISNRRDLIRTKGPISMRSDGVVLARDLPTTAPAIPGALWVDGGVLKRT